MNSNYMFLSALFFSTMITVSSNNWLGMWMGLEMNLMSFIPLISKSKNTKSSQAMMIYFLSQSMGSLMMLFSILASSFIMMNISFINELIYLMLMMSILIKLGMAPFHMWFPEMMSMMNWKECCLLATWQKVAPMVVMNNLYPNNWMMYLVIMMSTTVGAIGGLNQTSLRKMMAYSSINHMGWMMIIMSVKTLWYKYLIVYSVIVIMTMMFFNSKNMYFINQAISMSNSMTEKLTYFSLMMSLGGMPPFLGFFPKMMAIQLMIETNMFLLMTLTSLLSLIILFYYLRSMSSMIMSYSSINKWMNNKIMNKNMLYMMIMTNMALPTMSMINFF
uniref:NADH-ubiquinone oxidoreductase chain 2 n=1 Tax=Dinomachus sikhimensis TaxID=2813434 RepID=A0A8T9ZXV4_9HEMI|nr:NADH dehydrogenase subunit 2 [Dinomachus sikhimensis]